MTATRVQNFIGGRRVADANDGTVHVDVDPATGEALAEVQMDSVAHADAAVQAAREAFPAWAATPVGDRCQIMFRYKQILEDRFEELASMIVREHGKTMAEANGDVRRGIDCIEYACTAPTLMMGQSLPHIAVSSSFSRTENEGGVGLDSTADRVPLGVCVGITPFNFPIMVPMWMWPMAIACGNTFVLKPSEKVSLCAVREVELAHEAGLPAGVLNVVTGGPPVVDHLITHEHVKAVSFVGSSRVATHIYEKASGAGKRAQCMGGAKNYMIIMPDANRDAVIEGVLGSAFGNTGQRCLAGSVAIAVGDAAEWFVPRIVDAAESITVDRGDAPGVGMGPLIDEASRTRVLEYVELGTKEGADLALDGREAKVPATGCFVGPTVFDNVRPGMRIAEDEIFGPVLSVMREGTLDAALATMNRSAYGNMAVIFTSSGYDAHRFKTHAGAGMLGINVGVPAPMAVFPFAGWKNSFFGTLHANGEDAVRFYTEYRILVSRWLQILSTERMMPRITRAALIQASNDEAADASLQQIKKSMIDKHVALIARAADEGAKVCCLQELFYGPYFCAEQDTRWYAMTETVPDGPTTKLMQELAKKHEMVMVVPVYEVDMTGVFYNSAAVIDHHGTYLGKYRKHHIPHCHPGFWEKFYFKPGDLGYPVFETAFGRIGVYICYDRHFPEGARELGLNGAEIVFNPSATVAGLSEYLWKLEQPAHAVANQYFVGAINRVGTEAPWNIGEFYGTSYFCDPRGQILIEGSRDHDDVVVADLDLELIEEVRNVWQFFRDRRPESYEKITQH